MAFPGIPSYLACIAPHYYCNRFTGQCAVLQPQAVHRLHRQEQYEIQQRRAQAYTLSSGYFAAPVQAQTPPVIAHNYGPVGVGFGSFYGHPPGMGNSAYRHRDASHVAADIQASVRTPVPAPSQASASLQRSPAEIVDLTKDHSEQAPIMASPKAAPVPRAKPRSSFWKRGQQYLNNKLKNQSGSNVWRLLESMSALGPSDQKHRYCEAHWPTEEAAHKDIVEMSKYFIDVSEMLMYASKWDSLDKLSALEDSRDEVLLKRGQLEKEIADEKSSLVKALPKKRSNSQEWEKHAQWCNMVRNMSRNRFRDTFDIKHSAENVKSVIAREERKILKEMAKGNAASKKRKANKVPARVERPSKKLKAKSIRPDTPSEANAAYELAPNADSDVDAEGETEDEMELEPNLSFEDELAQEMEDLLMADRRPVEMRAPTLFQPYEPSENSIPRLEDIQQLQEQVNAPISPARLAAKKGNTAAHKDEGYYSVSPCSAGLLQQVTALKELNLSPTLREKQAVTRCEAVMEQVTAPAPCPDQAPQEADTVDADELPDTDIDCFFDFDYEAVNVAAVAVASAKSEEMGVFTVNNESRVSVNLLAPGTPNTTSDDDPAKVPPLRMTTDEIAALTARRNELTADCNDLNIFLAEDRDELAAMERGLDSLLHWRQVNSLFKQRTEDLIPNRRAKLSWLKCEVDLWEMELYEVEWEMAVLPKVPLIVGEIESKKGGKSKRVAGSCGGSKLGW
ncbi:hypothetical protein SVAN01_10745 [Stagonosporopsis vannaccii]|nr:hypothetical protein SVAN01_10745 [Stagonosporopsis vannaccii]